MSSADLAQLLEQYKAADAKGDKATVRAICDRVVRENTALVKKLVGKLTRKMENAGGPPEDPDDMYQSGCIGLLRAFPKWVPAKGAFSTYAAHWIRAEVQATSALGQYMRKPVNARRPWSVTKFQQAFLSKNGREPTAEEITAEMQRALPPDATARVKSKRVVTEKLMETWRETSAFQSMDQGLDGGGKRNGITTAIGSAKYTGNSGTSSVSEGVTSHDLIPDTKPNPEQRVANAEMAKKMAAGMKKLTPRESRIIVALFYENLSVKEIAAELSVCEDTIMKDRRAALATLNDAVSE